MPINYINGITSFITVPFKRFRFFLGHLYCKSAEFSGKLISSRKFLVYSNHMGQKIYKFIIKVSHNSSFVLPRNLFSLLTVLHVIILAIDASGSSQLFYKTEFLFV